jgi:hypothetical protein
MTVRRWMIVIVVMAIIFTYAALSIRMWRLANYHHTELSRPVGRSAMSHQRLYVQRVWHAEMEERYRRAVWFPFLAFEPAAPPP